MSDQQTQTADSGASPPTLNEGDGEKLTLSVLNHLIALMGSVAQEDIEWSETVSEPVSGIAFAREAIFVIANSGMKHSVAIGIFKKCMDALTAGEPVSDVFGHRGKAAAMETIWRDREQLHAGYLSAEDKIAYLEGLPWIGPITKFHLAKSFGINVSKPDVHLQRMAARQGCSVQALCEDLALQSGLRAATVDVVLWRAAATGFLDSRTGHLLGLSTNGDPVNNEARMSP